MDNPYSANQYPDLSLAQTPDVASGQQETFMPVELPHIPRAQPSFQDVPDIYRMGIVDTAPFDNLNLAGRNPLPAPPYEDQQPGDRINAPTFTAPDMAWPAARPFDFQAPGIDCPDPFAVNPQIAPDLLGLDQPHGLKIIAASSDPLAIDPLAPDLALYDRPDNLVMPNPLTVDPTLPDLQQPETKQEVNSMLADRPGEMSTASKAEFNGPDGDGDDDDGPMPPYAENNMTAGMSSRERKLNTLYKGMQQQRSL